MATEELTLPPAGLRVMRPGRESTTFLAADRRLGYWCCWAAGIALCLIALAIVVFMFVEGISYLRPSLFRDLAGAIAAAEQGRGFFDPIVGTLIMTAVGILIAAPIGVALAAWLSEYGRPPPTGARCWSQRSRSSPAHRAWYWRSSVLLVFSQSFLGFLSENAADGAVTGQSFLTAGANHGAARAAPDRGRPPARAWPPGPRPHARGLLRAGQDPAYERSGVCCCRRSARTSPAASCWAWAG